MGGDFFDYYTIGDELHLTIADVMGKGVGAAIIAASVRAVMRGASRFNDLVSTVNRSAAALELDLADTPTFATLFAARLRYDEAKLSYVDAGHGLAAVIDAEGHPRQLSSDDLPLGVLPDNRWSLHESA